MKSVNLYSVALALSVAACGGGGGTGGDGGGRGGSGGTGGVAAENHSPNLGIIGNHEITVGELLEIVLDVTDPDEGDILTLEADGTIGPNDDPFMASAAASWDAATGAFAFTPESADVGLYSVLFRVTDDGEPSMTASQTITITVVANRAPELHITSFTPGEAITATVGRQFDFTVWGTDLDTIDTLTLSVDGTVGPWADPFSATAAPTWSDTTGVFDWTPDATDAGCYALEFTVADDGAPSLADTEDVTIVVDPNFDPYFLDPPSHFTVSTDHTLDTIIIARDNNPPDGRSISSGAVDPDGPTDPYNMAFGVGAFAVFAGGIFTWTPDANVPVGPYQIWVEAKDNSQWEATTTIFIDIEVVAAAAPEFAPLRDRVVQTGATLSFVVSATDPDVEDTVTLSADGSVGPNNDPFAATVAATFDAPSGQFTWTPDAGDVGLYNVELTATDGTNPTQQVIQIEVVDAAQDYGDIVINELSFETPGDQFIELKNVGAHSVNLDGWNLAHESTFEVLVSHIVAPGDTVLIAWDHLDPSADYSLGHPSFGSNICEGATSLALYDTGGIAMGSAAIRGFVEWFQTGQYGESDALAATPPKWSQGSRLEAGSGSVCFLGDDPTSADGYVYDATPTPGADNAGCL